MISVPKTHKNDMHAFKPVA